jgi:hypothetical protein
MISGSKRFARCCLQRFPMADCCSFPIPGVQGPSTQTYFDVKAIGVHGGGSAMERSVSGAMPVVKQGQGTSISYNDSDTNRGGVSPRAGGKPSAYESIPGFAPAPQAQHQTAPAGNSNYGSFPLDKQPAVMASIPAAQPQVQTAPANSNYASFMPNAPAQLQQVPPQQIQMKSAAPAAAAPAQQQGGNYFSFMPAQGVQTAPAGQPQHAAAHAQAPMMQQTQGGNYGNFASLGSSTAPAGAVIPPQGPGAAPPSSNYGNFGSMQTAPAALENRNPQPVQHQHQPADPNNSNYFSFQPVAASQPMQSGQYFEGAPQTSASPRFQRPVVKEEPRNPKSDSANKKSTSAGAGLGGVSAGSIMEGVGSLVDEKKKSKEKSKSKEKGKSKEKSKSKDKDKEKSKSKSKK